MRKRLTQREMKQQAPETVAKRLFRGVFAMRDPEEVAWTRVVEYEKAQRLTPLGFKKERSIQTG